MVQGRADQDQQIADTCKPCCGLYVCPTNIWQYRRVSVHNLGNSGVDLPASGWLLSKGAGYPPNVMSTRGGTLTCQLYLRERFLPACGSVWPLLGTLPANVGGKGPKGPGSDIIGSFVGAP